MRKGVDQRLSANAVNLVPDARPQRLLPAGDTDAKVDIGWNREFLLNAGQGQNQIQRVRVRRTQVSNRVPAFLYPLVHDLKNAI